MIDVAGPLQAAIRAALLADAGVIAAFGAKPVRVYEIPPVNAPTPYLTVGDVDLHPLEYEFCAIAEADVTVHAWSVTDPPGDAECKAIAAAVVEVLLALGSAPGVAISAIGLQHVRHLIDADGRTAHGLVTARFTTQPAN